MVAKSASKHRRSRRGRRPVLVVKPSGDFHPRVKKAGPERFGIVSVDCAKARSKWMLADFYGSVLIDPTEVTHRRGDFGAAIAQLRDAIDSHQIKDLIVAVERTGRYHHPIKSAFAGAGFEVRTVHPYATKQFRQPANPGIKTDDTDLAAIHRAAVNGFGLIDFRSEPVYRKLQLLARHRRDLVEKKATLCCQIREHLDAVMPGYAACFDRVWRNDIPLTIAKQTGSPEALLKADVPGLTAILRNAGLRFQTATLERAVVWAQGAPASDVERETHQQIWIAQDEDRIKKNLEIKHLEQQLAQLLVQTPYVLLLSIVGVNVVTAAEFAGEMGPISNYPTAKAITGRAGLFPSRYQSDEVDHCDGPLVRHANRRLRAIILLIADNLICCNQYYRQLNQVWKAAGKDPRHNHVKVASRFSRVAFQLVAGKQVFRHRCCRGRSYIVDKLMAFHLEHDTPMSQMLADLNTAIEQIPTSEHHAEAKPLAEELEKIRAGRRRQPTPIGEILPLVLARLGVQEVESRTSGDQDPTAGSGREPMNAD